MLGSWVYVACLRSAITKHFIYIQVWTLFTPISAWYAPNKEILKSQNLFGENHIEKKKRTVQQESTAQLLSILNSHTVKFHSQTQKLDPSCTTW